MRTKIAVISSLAALVAVVPAAAWAEEDAPPAPAGAAGVTPPPAEAGEPAPAAPQPAAPEAGPKPAPGWIRIDSDFVGLQLWGGGTLPLTDTIGLAMDIYTNALVPGVAGSAFGEYDIGPAFTVGPMTLTPMIGLQFDFAAHKAAALVPQFYATGGPDPIYAELWFQYYNYKVFDGASNQINARLFVDYKVSDYFAVGPEIDLNYDSNGLPNNSGELKKVYKLPIGVNTMFTNLGAASTLMAFVGYETGDPTAQKNHLTGRLTYIHNF